MGREMGWRRDMGWGGRRVRGRWVGETGEGKEIGLGKEMDLEREKGLGEEV